MEALFNSLKSKFSKNVAQVVNTCQQKYSYECLFETSQFLIDRAPFKPKIGIICGSGLGSLGDGLTNPVALPYKSIPNFPVSTVPGHTGQLIFGYLSGVPVVCMQGRFHYYEGYPLWKCAMPVRVMKLIGVSNLIATNAAGSVNKAYQVGDIMLIKDHINLVGLSGNNPLQGANDEHFGPRFPPMNMAYDRKLIEKAKLIANEEGFGDRVYEGVYTCIGGPTFETVAEMKMLDILGVDAVGMSTVHEVILAIHCNMTVFAFSLITDKGVFDYESRDKPNHVEVMNVGKTREKVLNRFVERIVEHIATDARIDKKN